MKRFSQTSGAVALVLAAAISLTSLFAAPLALAEEEGTKTAQAEGGGPNDPIFVDLAPMVLPVIDGDRIRQVLQFTVTLQVPDEKAADHVRAIRPVLTDAYIQDLYGALDRRRVLDGKIVDVARLRDELAKVSASVLGEKGFKSVLIQRVSQHIM